MRSSRVRRFDSTRDDEAVVAGTVEQVWAILADPEALAEMTPFVHHIADLGDGRWSWELRGIPLPGGKFAAAFTERMEFEEFHTIRFAHEDPDDRELAGATGVYRLTPVDATHTHLHITLGIHAWVPAPKLAAPLVQAAMQSAIAFMGDRFSKRMIAHLDS